jgi:hypothetical protein
VGHAAFVLVAGGLGERLGYKGKGCICVQGHVFAWSRQYCSKPLCLWLGAWGSAWATKVRAAFVYRGMC